MRADAAILTIVDVQMRLLPAVLNGPKIVARIRVLLEAAARLRVPVLVSEQYPRGLGATDESLQPLPPATAVIAKTCFSALQEPNFKHALERQNRSQVVLCGMEAHVCVLQTALELREAGQDVFVVADAVGSRTEESRQLGLERMRDRGVDIVNAEMVLFEWLQRAATEDFRALSAMIK